MKKVVIFIMILFLVSLQGGSTMANYNIQMGQRNSTDTEWDNHYPITTASNVKMQDGSDLESNLSLNSLSNVLQILKSKKALKVGLFGDSLVAGVGAAPIWFQLLFDEAQRSSGHSLLYDFALDTNGITYSNYAVSSTTPDVMLTHIVPLEQCLADSVYSAQVSAPLYTNPPALQAGYDLVILCTGANGGQYIPLMVEEFVRRFVEIGTEVILISPQGTQAVPTRAFLQDYKRIAKHYNIAFIDMNEEYYTASNEDWAYAYANYYLDNIHQSAQGHIVWADAIRKLLNQQNASVYAQPTTGKLPSRRLFYFTKENELAQSNYAISFVNLTPNHNGTLVNTDNSQGVKNPLTDHGLAQHIKLAPTQYAEFGFDNAVYAIPVFKLSGVETTADVIYNFTTTYKDAITLPASARIAASHTPTYEKYHMDGAALINYPTSKWLKVLCNSGEVQLLGALVFSQPNKRLKNVGSALPKGVTNTGTWSLTTWKSVTDMFNTITLNDSVKVEFVGSGIGVVLGLRNSCGIIEIKMDGVVLENFDSYYNQAGMGFITRQWLAKGYGKHTFEMKYIGENASAIAAVINTAPRLAYREFFVVDGRQDQTERAYLLQKWSE